MLVEPLVDEKHVVRTDSAPARVADEAGLGKKKPSSSTEMWRKARNKVKHVTTMKKQLINLQSLVKQTAFMKQKTAKEQERYVVMVMVSIVILGAATAMTKSAMFHIKAVGRWDNGHPYLFGYALTLTMAIFVLKAGLVFLHRFVGDESKQAEGGSVAKFADPEEISFSQRMCDLIMPWVLLVLFTFFEMLSATVASVGLLYGAPTTVFVLFKSSKVIFLAILSVIILRRKLNSAQWSALLFITLALIMATCAEGKGKKGESEFHMLGPALLLLSELFHAAMLVLQEISVREYWSDPLALLSASAVIGIFMTGMTMCKMQGVWVTLPDGGQRPASDPSDTWYMCMHNPALLSIWIIHLVVHVSQDAAHIIILKHISALARTLCDAIKLILMWGLGKVFWFFGVFPVLAEAWHPGLVGSWLMLPAIAIIIYSMLMFKNGVFHVFRRTKTGLETESEKFEGEARVKVDLDEGFFLNMFTSNKLQKQLMTRRRSRELRKGNTTMM